MGEKTDLSATVTHIYNYKHTLNAMMHPIWRGDEKELFMHITLGSLKKNVHLILHLLRRIQQMNIVILPLNHIADEKIFFTIMLRRNR